MALLAICIMDTQATSRLFLPGEIAHGSIPRIHSPTTLPVSHARNDCGILILKEGYPTGMGIVAIGDVRFSTLLSITHHIEALDCGILIFKEVYPTCRILRFSTLLSITPYRDAPTVCFGNFGYSLFRKCLLRITRIQIL